MVGHARPFLDDQTPVLFPPLQETDLCKAGDPDVDEGVHHRSHDQLAAPVRFEELRHRHVLSAGFELHRPPQCLAADLRQFLSHFLGKAEQHGLLQRHRRQEFLVDQPRFPASIKQRSDDILERENGEQRDNIGEALVERGLVRR